MALSIPSIADPRDPATPLKNAYAWLSSLSVDLRANAGRIVLTINPSPAAWQAEPVTTIAMELGHAGVPTLAELMADPEFAQAFNVIGSKLYGLAAAHVPALEGATEA